MLARRWRNGIPSVGCRSVQPLWKAVWRHLKKLKIDLPSDPVILLLGIYQKKSKILIWKSISTPVFTAALYTIAKIWQQPKGPSVDEWIKQLWDIYTMEFYPAGKKKKTLPFATARKNLENIMLSEISQSEKDKYHTWFHLYGESNEQTELIGKIETDSASRMTAMWGRCWGGGIKPKGKRTHGHIR